MVDHLQRILLRYPDLPVHSIRPIEGNGQNNDILVLNEEVVFRFPRSNQVIDQLAIEKSILSRVQSVLPLPVPRLAYSSLGTREAGEVFVGYSIIPGEPLTTDRLAALPADRRRFLARQLAGFLRSLHEFPSGFLGIDLPVQDGLEEWAGMYAEVRERLFPMMHPDARGTVAAFFEEALTYPERLAFEPCLRHGDFGPGNILYEGATGEISGIIDFSSAGRGDPAVDLAAVSLYGDEFVEWMAQAYPGLEAMRERARFYRGTFALQEALFGLREGDEEAFKAGMGNYK